MTTGRINQVTIAGRGFSRAPPSGGDGGTTATPPPLGLLRKGRRPTFTHGKRPITGRLAKPRTRVTNGGAATGSQAGRRPLRQSRPPQGRREGKVSTARLHAKRCNPQLHRQPARDAGRPPHVCAQRLSRNCRATRAMPQPEHGPAHGTPAGRSAEQRLLSTFNHTHSFLGAAPEPFGSRHDNRLDCAPHIVVSEP